MFKIKFLYRLINIAIIFVLFFVTFGFVIPVKAVFSTLPITVSLSATPAGPLTAYGSTDLSWTTTGNPDSCDASNYWSGTNINNGDPVTHRTGMTALFGAGPDPKTYVFNITCHKAGVPDATSTVKVVVQTAVNIVDFSATPDKLITPAHSAVLNWTVTGGVPSSCDLIHNYIHWNSDIGFVKTFSNVTSPYTIDDMTGTGYYINSVLCHKDGFADSASYTAIVPVLNPPPTNLSNSCNTAGDQMTLSWDLPFGYTETGIYTFLGANNENFSSGHTTDHLDGVYSYTLNVIPSQTYHVIIYTEKVSDYSSFSEYVTDNFTCYKVTPATATIKANPSDIPYNTASQITWDSTNATSCTVTPPNWLGTYGNQSTGNLTNTRIYNISCTPNGVNSNKSVTVNVLSQSKYDLNIIKSGRGKVDISPLGASCGDGCLRYVANDSVRITATPTPSRIFTGWSGDCFGKGVCSLIMDSQKSVIANFAVDPNYQEF